MERIRQAIVIFFAVLFCYCSLSKARCLKKEETGTFLQECIESAAPGTTNSVEKTNLILRAIFDHTNSTGEETPDDSDPKNQIAKQAMSCFSKKLEEVFPEIKQIWRDCSEISNSQRDKTVECMKNQERKICPLDKNDRSKRSTFSHMDLIVWSAQLNKLIPI